MPCPLLISSQSDYLIWVFDRNLIFNDKTVQIQISWLLQKPADLDLHCLLRQDMSCSAREGLTCKAIVPNIGNTDTRKHVNKYFKIYHMGSAMQKHVCGQRRFRSACASVQSDHGLCPQTESLDTKECFNGEEMPG